MKKFIYILILITAVLSPKLTAQETIQQKDVVVTENKINSENEPKSKMKFGSEKHRALVEGAPNKMQSTENILMKTCLALALVIGIILGLYVLLKKVNKKYLNLGLESPLRLQNKMVLDSKNYLALVRVYEEEHLLAIGPNGATLIAKYALVDKEEAEGTDFETILNKEGKAAVPIDAEKIINSIDLKPIKEMRHEKSR